MVQEGGMHGFPHRVVAPERKGDIGNAAGNVGMGQVGGNPARRLEEIQGVIGVFRNARADGQHVRVKDDVLLRELHPVHQQVIGPPRDADAVLVVGGLSFLVKGHHDDRRPVPLDQGGLPQEFLLSFLQGNGVDDALALHALQPGFQHLPFGGIHHEGDFGDVRLRGNQVQETDHGLPAFNQTVVKAEIQHQRAVFHLLARDGNRLLIVPLPDQAGEFGGTRHVAAFSDKKGVFFTGMVVSLVPGQAQGGGLGGRNAGGEAPPRPGRWRRCVPEWCRSSRPQYSGCPGRHTPS